MDIIWFCVITVVAVEIGLLTPPFGISVYIVRATLDDARISIGDIFAGALPFVLRMIAVPRRHTRCQLVSFLRAPSC